jgi:tripartite-type tricarboxylate transporter receptor subunit TctC
MKSLIKFLAVALLALSAYAEPVKIITNLPVGSGPDNITRKLAEELTNMWHVPVIVDNRPGAAGVVALEYYLNQPVDANTILMLDGGAWGTTPIIYNKEDKFAQLQIVTPLYSSDWILVANNKIKTPDDLRQAVKARPYFGSWGVGSSGHLCGIEVSAKLGIPTTHIPYKEYGQWFVDIINGDLPFSCASAGSSEQYYKAGKINWLGITSTKPDPDLPMVPTVTEFFGSTFQLDSAYAVFFINKQIDAQHVAQLRKDIKQALQTPMLKDAIKFVHGKTWNGTPEEFKQFVAKDIAYNRRVIDKLDIKINQ